MGFRRKLAAFLVLVLVIATMAACDPGSYISVFKQEKDSGSKETKDALANIVAPIKLMEDRSIYLNDKSDELVNLYVTVYKSYDDDGKAFTLDDLHSFRFTQGSSSPRLDILIQEGDEKGPKKGLLGYSDSEPNAVLETRGHSVQSSAQKSYRIKLYNETGLWKDQQTINLNKHPYDITRVRNKLSFDYFKLIPDFTSLRTVFVHLYVKDISKGNNGGFVDMGLYTQIEQPNKRFLRMHGLDSGGNLYKAESFEFLRYPDNIKAEDDPGFKKEEFDKILEIKGSSDHKKLIAMLEDVNNYQIDINKTVERHFDRDNYLTWLAVAIVTGNSDILTQNFYLYSPTNSDKWYFLPWDYDGAWGYITQERNRNRYQPWILGVARFWNSTLHRRFLKDSENIKALTDKINELTKIITPEKTKSLLESYYPIASRFVRSQPDMLHLGLPISEFEREYGELYSYPQKNVEMYLKSLESPMPVFLSEPATVGGKTNFRWDYSYDLQGDDLTYDFQLSTTPVFDRITYEKKGLIENTIEIDKPAQGVYYYRVIINDSKGNSQVAFDTYTDIDDIRYFGVVKFRVE